VSGHWINPRGYTLRPHHYDEHDGAVWSYNADPREPLTWADDGGFHLRPDRHFLTNLGSVPRLFRNLISQDRFPQAWIQHDSACEHHGAYFSRSEHGDYVLAPLTSAEACDLMRAGILASGGAPWLAGLIYWAVRLCGPQWSDGVCRRRSRLQGDD